MDGREQGEEEEESMVALSDTSANPRAMMVMHLDTNTAITTVEGTWWSVNIASTAFDYSLFFAIDDRNHFFLSRVSSRCGSPTISFILGGCTIINGILQIAATLFLFFIHLSVRLFLRQKGLLSIIR